MPTPAEQAVAVGDYWEGHPKPPPDNATPAQQADYQERMAQWNNKFGPGGAPPEPELPTIPGPPSPGASMPAARLGDLMSHGGKVGPVVTGMTAMVKIGGVFAACMGDQHICPAFNGPVPHVGGVITKASTTVKIGNKFAARVSDQGACTGPPAQVAMGCMNVKIG